MADKSEAKHTPGPWVAGRPDMQTIVDGVGSKFIYADGFCADGQNSIVVAIASGMDETRWPVVMANAKLIAAAPELLDALKDLLVAVTPIEVTEAETKAFAAIRKATT